MIAELASPPQLSPVIGRTSASAVDAAPTDATLVVDRAGVILFMDDAARALPTALVAMSGGIVRLFAPAARAIAGAAIAAAFDGAPPALPPGIPVAIGASDDVAREMRLTLVALTDPHGGHAAVAIRVREGAAEERRLDAVARGQRLEALGDLVLGVAHDFRNLLTSILGAAAHDGPAPAEDVAAIRSAAARGTALVEHLLRFGAGVAPTPRPVAVDRAARDLIALLQRLWRGRVRLCDDLAAPGACIEIDPTEFDQILLNLAVNARDAMLDGGRLTLSSRLIVPCPDPSGRPIERSSLVIEIADTGIGIAPEVVPRIFDPFFTTKRSRGGSGLGLATVQTLVRRAGGTIGVDSQVAIGTRFRLTFPCVSVPCVSVAVQQSAPVAPDRPTAIAADGVILLVDDDPGVRRLAERALRTRGWDVVAAASGEEALARIADARSRLLAVVTDLALPGLSGEALIGVLRARLGDPNVPILVASGYPGATSVAGVSVLAKPYLPDELVAAVDALLAPLTAPRPLT